MNPITIETSNYSTSDSNRGKLQLICQPSDAAASDIRIVATKSEIRRMADNLTDTVLIQYSRDFAAPITVGEAIGTMTYFPERGEPAVYALTASRSVEKRENVPKTLEEIINETNADPNPFPPFNFEFVVTVFGPVFILAALFIFIHRKRKKRRTHRLRAPKPVNRYVK